MDDAKKQAPDQPRLETNLAERDRIASENLTKLLERAINLYGICLRDYFSAFSTYTTATSILVAAIGFLAKDKQPSQLIFVVASCGMLVCWQWYISTASLRDQYAFFKKRITCIEQRLFAHERVELLMTRWLQCAREARDEINSLDPEVQQDVANLNFKFASLNGFWGMRGTMLPVIYSAVFFAVMTWVFGNGMVTWFGLNPIPRWVAPEAIGSWLALLAAIVWVLFLVVVIRSRGKARRDSRRSQKDTH